MQACYNMQNNTYIFKYQGKSFKLLPAKPKLNVFKPFIVKQSDPLPTIINESPQELDAKKLDLASQIFKKESPRECDTKELEQLPQIFNAKSP